MSISHVIKAPLGVQLYRIAFALSAAYFGRYLWHFRHIGSFDGLLILACFTCCSLLGVFYTCIRAPRSRWVLAALGILIPAIVFLGMSLMVWSRPEAWWDWLLCLILTVVLFSIPVTFAVALFRDTKTNEWFTKSTA